MTTTAEGDDNQPKPRAIDSAASWSAAAPGVLLHGLCDRRSAPRFELPLQPDDR